MEPSTPWTKISRLWRKKPPANSGRPNASVVLTNKPFNHEGSKMKVRYVKLTDGKPETYKAIAITQKDDVNTYTFGGKIFVFPKEQVFLNSQNQVVCTDTSLVRDASGSFSIGAVTKETGEDAILFVQAAVSNTDKLCNMTVDFENVPAEKVVARGSSQLVVILRPGERVVCNRSWFVLGQAGGKNEWLPKADRVTMFYDGQNIRVCSGANFSDVIGQDKAKKSLSSIIKYLENPQRLKQIGGRIPRGVLLIGEPGNGKTLLAQAVAGEANVPFFSMNGSDFINQNVGVGAANVRDLFNRARATNLPAIIFIDEICAIGSKRPSEHISSEHVQTLNALLAEMNGFDLHPHPIVLIGATNRPQVLDKALLRPGRFDRKIEVLNPKHDDLVKLYQHYGNLLPLSEGLNFELFAKKSIGLSGASVANVCNEAALMLFDEDPSGEAGARVTQSMLEQCIAQEIRQTVGSSKAKRFNVTEESITLDDVIGQAAAKDDVLDIISYLRDPGKYKRLGAHVPRGTLFLGPPGEGKTLLARAIAGTAQVPFFSVSGSEFVEMYVGTGAARVREVFEEARRNAPCILFIDEIDGLARKRRSGDTGGGGTDEREATLNQLLVEMDGFNSGDEPVILIAATNRKDVLDPAVLRPGRLDREAVFYKPALADRLQLLEYYTKGKKLHRSVNLELFARNTCGFSAASIENVCNEAVLLMMRRELTELTADLIDAAITRVTVGSSRKARVITEEERLNIAVHEAWHACAWHLASGGEGIARVTIQGAGESGGHVQILNDDRFLVTKKYLEARVTMTLAARAAQEIILDAIDTASSSDLRQARALAYSMVVDYGMSPLGDVSLVEGHEHSPAMREKIENAVEKILSDCDARARGYINRYRSQGKAVTEALLKHEVLLGPDFVAAFESVPLVPGSPEVVPAPAETGAYRA